jgi:hypothetical protein
VSAGELTVEIHFDDPHQAEQWDRWRLTFSDVAVETPYHFGPERGNVWSVGLACRNQSKCVKHLAGDEQRPDDDREGVDFQTEGEANAFFELVAGRRTSGLPVSPSTRPNASSRIEEGNYDLHTVPEGLEIFIDERPYGRTPILNVRLTPGRHRYRVNPPGPYAAAGEGFHDFPAGVHKVTLADYSDIRPAATQ